MRRHQAPRSEPLRRVAEAGRADGRAALPICARPSRRICVRARYLRHLVVLAFLVLDEVLGVVFRYLGLPVKDARVHGLGLGLYLAEASPERAEKSKDAGRIVVRASVIRFDF